MRRVPRVELLIVAVLSAATALAAAVGAWRASGAPALPPSLDGPCSVQARIEPGGVVVDPSVSAGVYELPVDGTVSYRATIGDAPPEGPRRLQGQVILELPRPLPDPVLASWDEDGSLADNVGTTTYRLGRWWAPSGAVVTIRADHREPGATCAGALTVRLGGNGLALRALLVALMLASAALTARAVRPSRSAVGPAGSGTGPGGGPGPWDPQPAASRARRFGPAGRPGLGLVAGAVHGLAASGLLLLTGSVALASPWLFAGPVAGATIGAALGWWAPGRAGRTGTAGRSTDDGGPELPLIDVP